ncbi:hypothetical protein BU24DRAFT_427181 [Aaosphaeria arxii CBS 175.79]|uniref:Uncharacterized protein n=1 Tax=Aaosphaeria arxii CBS 175.79 TaxID=1450172 RepID=A0A6A5XDM4_9PLEO|nr:uncharacterized protein BU24DRAFT_427181 [Aaosphaeria arxii CBS 175.79]KAF2010980.1 hypothetical protein BU24DRAFT_427181 [Aaosphaeria arxii CBS 175.79]
MPSLGSCLTLVPVQSEYQSPAWRLSSLGVCNWSFSLTILGKGSSLLNSKLWQPSMSIIKTYWDNCSMRLQERGGVSRTRRRECLSIATAQQSSQVGPAPQY